MRDRYFLPTRFAAWIEELSPAAVLTCNEGRHLASD
jgi:hypothetical protein